MQEERAEANLRQSGISTLLPKIKRIVRTRPNRERLRIEPLFPSYLFVRGDLNSIGRHVRYTRGVSRFVGTIDGGPTPVEDSIVEAIESRIGEDGYVQLVSGFAAGDRARITTGPLTGFVGVFQSYTNRDHRVHLLLAALHGHVRVVVDDTALERVG